MRWSIFTDILNRMTFLTLVLPRDFLKFLLISRSSNDSGQKVTNFINLAHFHTQFSCRGNAPFLSSCFATVLCSVPQRPLFHSSFFFHLLLLNYQCILGSSIYYSLSSELDTCYMVTPLGKPFTWLLLPLLI